MESKSNCSQVCFANANYRNVPLKAFPKTQFGNRKLAFDDTLYKENLLFDMHVGIFPFQIPQHLFLTPQLAFLTGRKLCVFY